MDGQSVVGFVWDDLDAKIWFCLQLLRLSDGVVSDFIQSIRGIGDELSKEDFLVGVESVDDQTHQLLDVSVESKNFFFTHVVLVIWLGFFNFNLILDENCVLFKSLESYSNFSRIF